MKEHIDPYRVANSMMQDTSFQGIFLLVEGNSDYHFFKKFFDREKCEIQQTMGAENTVQLIETLNERGFERKLAILDSDFRKLDGEVPNDKDILLVDDHDIEVMIFKYPALFRVLELHYSKSKYKSFLGRKSSDFRDVILNLASTIGYLKWANKKFNLGLVFKPKGQDGKPIKYSKFIDDKDMEFKGEEVLLKTVLDYSYQKSLTIKPIEEIKKGYELQIKEVVDLLQLCNGHDIANLISLSLRKAIGSKNLDYKAIEEDLILSFDSSEFKETELFVLIKEWQKESGKEILSEIFD